MSTSARRVGRAVRETLLTIAALGGVVCIVLTILAFTGGYTLIMFKTGSMSPTIPAGSVALVQRIPASEIRVGDVVTVDRADALPVTHRVTSVEAGSATDQRIVTLKGDANETEDPAPYVVTDARIVRGSVPHLANVIVWFGNPLVLGAITIGAALLVTWAFWPKDGGRHDDDTDDTDDTDDDAAVSPSAPPQTRKERRAAGVLGIAALIAASAVPFAATEPAQAAGALRLDSDLSGTHVLDAVDPLDWHVDIDASALPDDGELTVALSGEETTGAMQITAEIRSCASAWTADGCPGGEDLLRAAAPVLMDGTWERVLEEPTPGIAHLRIALTSPSTPVEPISASLTIRATAAEEVVEEHLNGETELPRTGGTSWGLAAAPAAVLIGLGIALLARTRRRSAP